MQSCSSRHDDVKCLVCCTDIFLFKHFSKHDPTFEFGKHVLDMSASGVVYKCNEQRLIITNKENKKADYNVA